MTRIKYILFLLFISTSVFASASKKHILLPHSATLLGESCKDKADNYFTYKKICSLLVQKAIGGYSAS